MIDEEAYIILRYSRNIADGYGFVWNSGDAPLWGSTSLSWTILLGISSAITGLPLTFLVRFLGVGIAIMIILVICHIAPNDLSGTILGSFIAVSPMVGHALVGLDVLLFALVLLLTYVRRNDNLVFVGLCILLSVTRPEGLLLAGVFLMVHYYENRNIKIVLLFAVIGAVVFGSILLYFGDFIPNALYIKTISDKNTLVLFSENLRRVLGHLTRIESLVPLVLVLIYMLTRLTNRAIWKVIMGLLPVFLYYGIYLFIHQTQNVLGRFQFVTVPLFYIICIAGVGAMFINPKTRTHLLILLCLFGLLIATEYNSTATLLNPNTEDTNKIAVGLALSEFSDLTLATTDAGIVPYYSQWRTIDISGLDDWTIAREGFSTEYLDGIDIHLFMTHSKTENWSVMTTDPLFVVPIQYFIEQRNFTLIMVNPYSVDVGVFNYYFIAPSFVLREDVIRALCNIETFEYAYNYLEGF